MILREGIVKLSNCSGSLIKFEGQNQDAKAIVLTNGHCIKKRFTGSMLGPEEVMINVKKRRKMKLFKDQDKLFDIMSAKIIYATMTDTDLALFELTETYQEIFDRTGVKPLTLSSTRSYEGVPINIISGYWERGYSCKIEKFIFIIKEASWTFKDSIRYSKGCETIGGTSGSPIIEADTRIVIGVNNSANESGGRCKMNNPCEIDKDGKLFYQKGMKYGQQTYQVYSCLNSDLIFDINIRNCSLPK